VAASDAYASTVIRRYALFGGMVALGALGVYWGGRAFAGGVPSWVLALGVAALGALGGWMISRRDTEDIRRLQGVVESMVEGQFAKRSRIRRSGDLGRLGRSVDALGERLAVGEVQEHSRQERLRTILDAMNEAVLVTDSNGRIALHNEVLKELVGGDVVGKTAVEAIRHPNFHRAIEEAQRGIPTALEIEMRDVEGRKRKSLRASVSPLPDRRGIVSVFHDVSAEREAERVRRDFVANASHELRTPLTAIRGFAETLREGAIEDPEVAKGFLDVILRHTKRLQALVSDLADLSRFEGKDMELDLHPVAPEKLISTVVEGLAAQSRAKGLKVVLPEPGLRLMVRAEERALEQVLVNLIDNAIKYTPDSGEIRISIGREGGEALIEVANTGPGIPAKHLPRVFERFYRVDAGRSRELGGTGLGLSIVKHLVAKMGGQITAQSQEGWTRFQVRLAEAERPESDTLLSQN
jgi:two-component system phosphate regulon sensor histidine kinase PhoR